MAMMLAEIHGHADLYREASRFVLDQRESNPTTWCTVGLGAIDGQQHGAQTIWPT